MQQAQGFTLSAERHTQVGAYFCFTQVLAAQLRRRGSHHVCAPPAQRPAVLWGELWLNRQRFAPGAHFFEQVTVRVEAIERPRQVRKQSVGVLPQHRVHLIFGQAALQQVAHLVQPDGLLVAFFQFFHPHRQLLVGMVQRLLGAFSLGDIAHHHLHAWSFLQVEPCQRHVHIEKSLVGAAVPPFEKLRYSGQGAQDLFAESLRGIPAIWLVGRGEIAQWPADELAARAVEHFQGARIAVDQVTFVKDQDRIPSRLEQGAVARLAFT